MSVPLPSPSTVPGSSAKPIPRSRPTPVSLDISADAHSPQSPAKSATTRRGSKSAGVGGTLGQSPGYETNWRERSSGSGSKSSKGPERTVGGFGKKESTSASGNTPGGGGGAWTTVGGSALSPDSKKSSAEKAAALAHVPCRFYKAGTCTAGDSCPFSHEGGGKKEVCQWFLKGNCKFGHKCALAHLRPGEPISMDRKNKKAAQLEAKGEKPPSSTPEEPAATPVPIRSALSSSLQTPPPATSTKVSSSPMREPYGPPSGATGSGSPSAGFLGRSPGAFGASPNRPSPLSSSFSARLSVPGPLALKGTPTTAVHAARLPVTAGPAAQFSSSFSHSPLTPEHSKPPLSASLADSSYLRRSIWARSETPDEPLSPRRPILPQARNSQPDVFDEDDDDHGEDLLPSSLSDLLTPIERARRLSRRDSNDYFGVSPARSASGNHPVFSGERLAQSAGAAMGPAGFLQSLWSPGTRSSTGETNLQFGPSTATPPPASRQSLLSQQRSPISPLRNQANTQPKSPWRPEPDPSGEIMDYSNLTPPFFARAPDPSSPSARALSEHAPGQSLPGGVATALSRLHLQGETRGETISLETAKVDEGDDKGREDREEVMFTMDG